MIGIVSALNLKMKMFATMIVMFALGYGLLYAVMLYLGAGVAVIAAVAILFIIAQWYLGPAILRAAGHLRYISENEYPELHRTVEELAGEAHVPVPRIAIAPAKEPNAFVFGRTVRGSTLVVHEGLLSTLDGNELRAVLAHEVGHLRHNDVVIMTVVAFIPMLAYILAQNMFLSGMLGGNRNNGFAYLFLIGLLAFVVYAVSQLFMLSLSRTRESYADEYSARATGRPEHLASALFKISTSHAAQRSRPSTASAAARSFYIVDLFGAKRDIEQLAQHSKELKRLLPSVDMEEFIQKARNERESAWGAMNAMFSTHPPTYKRLLDLAAVKDDMESDA